MNDTGTCHWAGQLQMSLNQFHALLIHELIGRQDLSQHGSAGCKCFQNLSETLTPFRQNREESGTKNSSPKPCKKFEKVYQASGHLSHLQKMQPPTPHGFRSAVPVMV